MRATSSPSRTAAPTALRTGSLEHNIDLPTRRAAAVVEGLVDNHGIAADRLTPQGVGPLAPVDSNDTEAGRALNRRVELVKS